MTTRTKPSPIEILADACLRDAVEAGAAFVVFDPWLDEVLFADAAGRALVGSMDAPASPALRQVRSAARSLTEKGRARVLLRQSTRIGTRILTADLTLRPAGAGRQAFAVMTVAGLGTPGDAEHLLEMAGLGGSAAALYGKGAERVATPSFAERPIPDLAERIERFESGPDAIATEDDGALKLTLARAPFGRILVLAEPSALSSAEAPATDVAPETDGADGGPPERPASDSLHGTGTGSGTGTMSMGALLQRWHSRGPVTSAADAADAEALDASASSVPPAEPEPEADGVVALPDAAPGDAAAQASAVAAETNAEEPSLSPEPATPEPRLRRHSNWGPRVAAAVPPSDEADVSVVDPGPDDPAEPASAKADLPLETAPSAPAEDDGAAVSEAGASAESEAPAPAGAGFMPRFDIAPVRFVWQIDRDGAFRFLSPDFAGAVGPNAADVVGRSFGAVARVFGFDGTGEIARLLDRRDTWSGRTIFWPVQGSDRKVPVDLAALPVYGRDRSFDGFRGFGIVRLNESVPDDDKLGLVLTTGLAPADAEPDRAIDDTAPGEGDRRETKPFLRRFEADGLGRRLEPPQVADDVDSAGPAETGETEGAPKVIRLEERRRPRDGALSVAEEAAFRAIGAKLGNHSEAESPGALRFEDTEAAARAAKDAAAAATPVAADAPSAGEPPQSSSDAATGAVSDAPRGAESPSTASSASPEADSARLRRSLARLKASESSDIEPALEALSEKLARAEEEADRRLAARRSPASAGMADAPAAGGEAASDEPAAEPEPVNAEIGGETSVAAFDAPTSDDVPAGTEEIRPADGLPQPFAEAVLEAAEPTGEQPGEAVVAPAPADAAENGATVPTPDDGEISAMAEVVAEPAAIARAEPIETAAAATGTSGVDDAATAAKPDEALDEDEDHETPLDLAVFERLFAALPLAVLVQVREHTVYVNAEFAGLTGHADVASVEAAGGLDALILDRQGEGTLALRRTDGEAVEVRAHMQRIADCGRSALLMSFQPVPEDGAGIGPLLEDLRQEVEELQAVLDTATDGVVLLDMPGNIRAMNGSAHALFGIGTDVAFGNHLSSLFAPESQKATLDYLEMLRDDGLGGILNDGREVIGRVSQGGSIPLFITIGRLTGERGWCVVIRDIAHWKRIEEDLVNARRQAEAASLHKSRFLANISHELRTPLNAIIGFADVMSSECFGPIGNERYLEYLGDIKRSGHHVLDLVNDLLDISKIEAGKIELSFEAVSLNEVVSEVVSLMQPQANRERVIVRSNLPSSVPPVVADRRTMRQIALNLVANAIRFTPAGGQIIASTTYTAEGDVLLRFRDSGIGMTEREIELALTPFQQVHAPSANRGEGTGLGLPLTKAMVEANRAQFAIHSTPGEGTLVEIAFPAPRVLAD